MRLVGVYPGRRSQQGFTLIELMIASVIGLLLLSAVLAVFVSSSRTYRLQESMSRVQESGRFALEMLTRDIREAGYGLDNSEPAIRGYADVLSARGAGQARLLAKDRASGEVLYIPKYVVGFDKHGKEKVRGDITYFVAKETDGPLTLYKRATPSKPGNDPAPQPLVEGVEGIVFQYGEDTNSDRQVNRFVTAAGVADWSKVLAIRLNVLVSGIDKGVVDQPQKQLPDPFAAVSTADRRLYQVYKSTVALRNRLP